MKKMIFGLALMSSVGFAQNETLLESFVQTFPEAVADAVLIDGPINALLWGLDSGSVGSMALGTGAAVVGYSIRKTCNNYGFNGTNSVWCGVLGGSLKYSGKAAINGKYTYAESLIGAVDAGTYEGTAAYRGVWPTLEWMAIETGVNGLAYLARPKDDTTNLVKELKSGAAVGVLVSVFVNTCHAWYSADLQAGIKAWMSGSNENGDL